MFLLYFLWCCCCVLLSFYLVGRKLSQLMANNKQITGHQCVQLLAPPPCTWKTILHVCARLVAVVYIRNPTILPPGTNVPFFFFPSYTQSNLIPYFFFASSILKFPHTRSKGQKFKRFKMYRRLQVTGMSLKIPSINQRQQILHGGDLVHAILFF